MPADDARLMCSGIHSAATAGLEIASCDEGTDGG